MSVRVQERDLRAVLPPAADESPVEYSERLAAAFAPSDEVRKSLGQYFTPAPIARFMAELLLDGSDRMSRVLDPAAGTGVLACAVCELIGCGSAPLHIDAQDVDDRAAPLLQAALAHSQSWLRERGTKMSYTVSVGDFVSEHADALEGSLFRPPDEYDAVIMNPPYFKLRKEDPRSRAAASVVHGQPNIYALFMAIGASMLREGGVLVSINPRSFATGTYFKRFRQRFFGSMSLEAVHLFDARADAFGRDSVLQENVVLRARKVRADASRSHDVLVSASAGVADIHDRRIRRVPGTSVVDPSTPDMLMSIPTSEEDDAVVSAVRAWGSSLGALGLDVSTGPVVAFRAQEFLRESNGDDTAPLLWLSNVRNGVVEWPRGGSRKQQHIEVGERSMRLLVRNRTTVLMRRFTAKEETRRLTAALLPGGQLPGEWLGLENHLNYIHSPAGELDLRVAGGLVGLLGGGLLDRYFRISNGNTQVNAAELRVLPLPSTPLLLALGEALESVEIGSVQHDQVVAETLGLEPLTP